MEVGEALATLEQFPGRANRISIYLTGANRTTNRLAAWRASQLAQFLGLLSQNVEDLREGYSQQRITKIAWAARNLLELSIWVDYCNLSDSNAKKFNDDTGRDLLEFGQITQKVFDAYGSGPSAELNAVMQEMVKVAPSKFGITGIEDDYTKVREAAEVLGAHSRYAANFKRYSKYAHPTALAMHSVLPGVIEVEEGLRNEFLKDGAHFSSAALSGIGDVVLKSFDPGHAPNKGP
ncbi:MAG: hypothetical protein WB561_09155 [Terracidiphilus sp.]